MFCFLVQFYVGEITKYCLLVDRIARPTSLAWCSVIAINDCSVHTYSHVSQAFRVDDNVASRALEDFLLGSFAELNQYY